MKKRHRHPERDGRQGSRDAMQVLGTLQGQKSGVLLSSTLSFLPQISLAARNLCKSVSLRFSSHDSSTKVLLVPSSCSHLFLTEPPEGGREHQSQLKAPTSFRTKVHTATHLLYSRHIPAAGPLHKRFLLPRLQTLPSDLSSTVTFSGRPPQSTHVN
jgi:hypothetical protein